MLDQVDGGVVRPVHVLQHQHHGLVLRQARQVGVDAGGDEVRCFARLESLGGRRLVVQPQQREEGLQPGRLRSVRTVMALQIPGLTANVQAPQQADELRIRRALLGSQGVQ